MDVMTSAAAATTAKDELSPAVRETTQAAAARVKCEGVVFTVTEDNEVAQVGRGGAARVLGSESFLDDAAAPTCMTRQHFVDVQGKAEAMLFLVAVREDLRRIVMSTGFLSCSL